MFLLCFLQYFKIVVQIAISFDDSFALLLRLGILPRLLAIAFKNFVVVVLLLPAVVAVLNYFQRNFFSFPIVLNFLGVSLFV